jgi:uncharacterized metal-binding protein
MSCIESERGVDYCDKRPNVLTEPRWRMIIFPCSGCGKTSWFSKEITYAEAVDLASDLTLRCVECE